MNKRGFFYQAACSKTISPSHSPSHFFETNDW